MQHGTIQSSMDRDSPRRIFTYFISHARERHPEWSRLQELTFTAAIGFATYLIVWLLFGFVPMGYVAGSKPLCGLLARSR